MKRQGQTRGGIDPATDRTISIRLVQRSGCLEGNLPGSVRQPCNPELGPGKYLEALRVSPLEPSDPPEQSHRKLFPP
jgi:hypothetical protein